MSEQNQMAINPVVAGGIGAAAGIGAGYLIKPLHSIKGDYGDVTKLLTMDKDTFQAVADAAKDAEKDSDAAKAYKKLEEGRKIVSDAGDELVKEKTKATNTMNAAIEKDLEANLTGDAKTKFAEAVKTEKNELDAAKKAVADKRDALKTAAADPASELAKKQKAYKDAYNTAVTNIVNKKDEGLGKDLAELEDKLAKETDAAKKTEIEKQIKAKKAEIGREALKQEAVTTAHTEMQTEKHKILSAEDAKTNATTLKSKQEAYNKKVVAAADEALTDVTAKSDGNTLEKLKHTIEEQKKILAKNAEEVKAEKAGKLVGEGGTLKDFDIKSIKEFLPKAKGKAMAIGAAALGLAGVALAYIVGPKNGVPTDVA